MLKMYMLFDFEGTCAGAMEDIIEVVFNQKDMPIERADYLCYEIELDLVDKFYEGWTCSQCGPEMKIITKEEAEEKGIDHTVNIEDFRKIMFYKNGSGLWDSPRCRECCTDCSSYCGEPCPLDFEKTCDNCVFKNGYKRTLTFDIG